MPVKDMPRVAFDATNMTITPTDPETLREKERAQRESVESTDKKFSDEVEVNERNGEIIRKVDPAEPRSEDAAKGAESRFRRAAPDALPTPSVSFDGLSIFDTAGVGQSFIPPDTNGEVGPNHFVQTVNSAFRVWDKSGTPLIPTTRLGTLFSALSGPCASANNGDPVVIYDQLADRWMISEFCFSNAFPNHQLIAISKTADPTGAYFLYDFVMPNTKFNDYPKFGMWPDGYYMTDNQFDQSGDNFLGSGYFAFDRAKMLAGDPKASYIYFDSCPERLNCTTGGVLPSDLDGFIPPPAGTPNTFAYFTAGEFGDPQGDGLRLFDFHADFANPSNSTFVERVGSPMPVAAFDPVVTNITQPPPGTAGTILDTLSDRLMFRLSYRNFGGKESLLLTHTVNIAASSPNPAHGAVRYYQLDRSSPASAYSIAEQQTFTPDSTSRWMSSGAMNYLGDTAIGYSASSSTVFPSIRYAARLASDPAGSGLAQGEQNIMVGGGSQTSTSQRWGDYSDISVDPADDCSFWYTQEYYAASGGGVWRTRVAKFAPRPCSAVGQGAIVGTVTSCSTGAVLDSVSVTAAGGYQRLTSSSGAFTMSILPGVYDVSFSKFGYASSTVSGVSLTNGGTANANVCLAPAPVPTAPSVEIMTDNNVLDPNECNLLRIPIVNNGLATATNVSATIATTTPGVTIETPTSTYTDISPGNFGNNFTPFRISTNDSIACFTSVSIKMTINVSGLPPTVVSFTLPIGQPGDPNYVFANSTGASIPNSGTLIAGSQADDFLVPIQLPAGFSTKVYRVPVTSLTADTNGNLRINGVGSSAPENQPLPTEGGGGQSGVVPTLTPTLFPYWDDLDMSPAVTAGGGIFTETTGIAPNRTFKIEWRARNWVQNQGLAPADVDFAILLHEGGSNFEYVYGAVPSGGAFSSAQSATIGSQADGTSFVKNQYSYNTSSVTTGRMLSASPASPGICVQGSGVCPAIMPVSISGRVLTPASTGLKSAKVTLIGPFSTRSVLTNSFGNFSFDQVDSNTSYIIGVSSKKFRFERLGLFPDNAGTSDLIFMGTE